MKKGIKGTKLIDLQMTDEMLKTTMSRIQPFLEKYYREQQMSFNFPKIKTMNMQELVVSIYIQGLVDAVELYKNGKLEDLEELFNNT